MAKSIARLCDMREGKALQLFVEDDGDVIVSVIPEDGMYSKGAQFCISGTQSRRTTEALHNLFEAMRHDEGVIPHEVGMKLEEPSNDG